MMTPQALALPLLRGPTTLEAALEQEDNMLVNLAYPELGIDFFVWFYTHRADIESTVSYHLGLSGSEMPTWRCGRVDTRQFQRVYTSLCRQLVQEPRATFHHQISLALQDRRGYKSRKRR